MLSLPYGFCADYQPSFSAQRGRVVGPTLLRGAWADSLSACGLRASPLPPVRAAPDCVHRLRAENWADARGNRRGTRQAAGRSHPHKPGLGPSLRQMDETDRPKDRGAQPSQGRAHAMHWMRMPFDRQMRACEPSRPSRIQSWRTGPWHQIASTPPGASRSYAAARVDSA